MCHNKSHYIHIAEKGALADTSAEDVDAMFIQLAKKDKVVIHLHGGLVSKSDGLNVAERLERDCYRPADAHAVFFVWESDLLTVLRRNLPAIFGEDLFKILLKWLLKFTASKFIDHSGRKGEPVPLISEMEIYKELAKNDVGGEAFDDLPVPAEVAEITPKERVAFETALGRDLSLRTATQAVIDTARPIPPGTDSAKGAKVRGQHQTVTLLSPEIVAELIDEDGQARAEGRKGIFTNPKLIAAAATIFVRVVRRFRQRRDHGLYPTVVEEILRKLYIANVGLKIWKAMKDQTRLTFATEDSPTRGGAYFARKLCEMLAAARSAPEISIVGHSAGAVFANHLLAHLHRLRDDPQNAVPADFAFKNVVFLAPACTFDNFLPTMTAHRAMFHHFRMFTMTDAAESRDVLVHRVYTRSLLYFISGVLEPGEGGGTDFDKPIVGMERYYTERSIYASSEIEEARRFFAAIPDSIVWSPISTGTGDGLLSTALKHGDFDDDAVTLESLRHLLSH